MNTPLAGPCGDTGLGAHTLRIRALPFDTLRENVVVVGRGCRVFRPERFVGTGKAELKANGKKLIASINIAEEPGLLGPDEVGLSQPAFRRLGLPEGSLVTLAPARPPESFHHVRRKVVGEVLDDAAFRDVVRDLVEHRYSDMEVSAFLIACASALTHDELLSLTRAMINSGQRLAWPSTPIVDKHCIGGIPGNRTSLIVVPILVAHGFTVPKTSSRAITSPAGTADTMELLARVDLSVDELRAVVDKAGGCIAWGGHVNLAPADDILISVERPLGIDTPEQMVASILSKKAAAGSTHLLIDLPMGPTAKVRSPAEALRLRKLFEFIVARIGLQIEVMVTDGAQPVGRGVGPELDIRDVLAILEGRPEAPASLRRGAAGAGAHDRGRNHELLRPTPKTDQSRALERLSGWHVIVAGSGMCDAGRIRHHLKRLLWKRETTLLITGFQAAGTLGRLRRDGARSVRIQGEFVKVRASVRTLDVYSGHADAPGLQSWLQARLPVRGSIFLTHGEPENLAALGKRLAAMGVGEARVVTPEMDAAVRLGHARAEAVDLEEAPRIAPGAAASLDWHNARSRLLIVLDQALADAPDDRSRQDILDRLAAAVGA